MAGPAARGSARIRIRYVPQTLRTGNTAEMGAEGTAEGGASVASDLEENGISINTFGELNALIIR